MAIMGDKNDYEEEQYSQTYLNLGNKVKVNKELLCYDNEGRY